MLISSGISLVRAEIFSIAFAELLSATSFKMRVGVGGGTGADAY